MKATRFYSVVMLAWFIPASSQAGTAIVNSTGSSDETLLMVLIAIAMLQVVAIAIIGGVIRVIASNAEIWNQRWNNKLPATAALIILSTSVTNAQDRNFEALVRMDDTAFIALIAINVVLFMAFIYLSARLNSLLRMMMRDEEGKVPTTFLDKINAMLTDAVPIEREKEVETDHVYDGIRELDNNLPPWWLWGFYFSIVFAGVYIVNYHFGGGGQSQLQEYQSELTSAEEARAANAASSGTATVDEANVDFLTDAASLGEGKKIFALYCAPCHGATGGSAPGGVGPNLADDYWINGGSMNDIYKTIKVGVPSKGMVSWEAQLSPVKIHQVSSFIKSLAGSNPENAKEPQGELWKDEVTSVTATEDSAAIAE